MSDPYIGDPNAVLIMRRMDNDPRVTPAWRALIHEFGVVIVGKMIEQGYKNIDAAREELEVWRGRRQERWLRTDFVGKSTRDAIMTYIRRRPRGRQ